MENVLGGVLFIWKEIDFKQLVLRLLLNFTLCAERCGLFEKARAARLHTSKSHRPGRLSDSEEERSVICKQGIPGRKHNKHKHKHKHKRKKKKKKKLDKEKRLEM